MKKIKYGGRKNEVQHKQLQNLREGDQICEAVLDTLSDDYLDYISHLVKSSKTPIKSNTLIEKEQQSSNSQPEQKCQVQSTMHNDKKSISKYQPRIRHHSESGGKSSNNPNFREEIVKKIGKDFVQQIPRKLSYHKDKQSIMREQSNQKKKKKKNEYSGLEVDIKNEQKTMSFTRNYRQGSKNKDESVFREGFNKKQLNSNKPKYYTNYQEYSESSNEKMSINENIIINQRQSQRQTVENNFLNQIDNYISHLQSNPSSKMVQSRLFSKKQQRQKYLKEFTAKERKKSRQYDDEYGEYNIQEILKENLKLNKKVKSYEKKIEELEDEVSSHLIQCRNRQKNAKNKMQDLWKALTQAVSKIQNQKCQIVSMKTLLKSFGQKVRQIENENEDSEDGDDISQSIIKYIAPQRHSSELRTKYKRGLESTMPKHEEDRRFWRE